MSDTKTILTCAVSGNITTRAQNPALPILPKEIVQEAIAAWNAGAAIVHLHVRDPQTGHGSMELSLYREVVEGIRAAGSDVIINLTTGEGGRFVPTPGNPRVPAEGTNLCAPELRVAHIAALRPDICTLDFNTMVSGGRVVMNPPQSLEVMAHTIREAGTRPELEVFDSGDLNMAKSFIERGLIDSPALFQLVLGVNFGAASNFETLAYLVSQLPQEREWAAFGVGRDAFRVLAMAYLLGGHVRVGLEDTVYLERGRLATGNAELVEKGVGIIECLGGSMASPTEARAILGLSGPR